MKIVQPYIRITSLLLTGIIIGAIAVVALFNIFHRPNNQEFNPSDHQTAMLACLEKVIQKIAPNKISAGLYERFWRLCGNQIFNGLYLDDFKIRREKFLRQELDERVNLWLVVSITISGVVLAAVQLFLSYRLAVKGYAEFAKDSELSVEAGKISLRSSITGTVILAISL